MKKTLKKLQRTKKAISNYFAKRKKLTQTLQDNLHKIWFGMFIFMCLSYCACGTTKLTATIHQPADGSQSTISITTNTPITSNVEPNTNVEFKTTK